MFILYKDFTLNLFYILFIPTVLFALIHRKKDHIWTYRILIFLVFSLSLVSSMSVPVTIMDLTYDFRAIPLTIGSLYGGIPVAILLYLILIGYRFIMGDPNQLEYIIAIVPTFLILSWFVTIFPTLSFGRKLMASFGAYLTVRLLTLITYQILTGKAASFFKPEFAGTMTLILFQSLVACLFIYILEFIVKVQLLQEEIRMTEKLKLVTGIAASVAHEVRNPLTAVRGFIQLLGKAELNQHNREYYRKICLEELDRAQQIISDYLTLAKPDPEKIESVHIHEEIQYAAKVLSSYANMQNVEITMELCVEDLQLIGDQSKFRQAIINLCKNSIEAMPDGGTLTLETRLDKSGFILRIKDNGIGMTKEQINRLGTPFYSTKEKGTGLGTMVTFSIIRNMNGDIVTVSEPGKGTTFDIAFPDSAAQSPITERKKRSDSN
ncbi:ATP-binding protein [Paenibacillus solisilvae]|uniref:histidine kinase n=1 Tax=Paenibacillus solisilvae TaxID=2486751 RepID=A0ABW0W644_9BACL